MVCNGEPNNEEINGSCNEPMDESPNLEQDNMEDNEEEEMNDDEEQEEEEGEDDYDQLDHDLDALNIVLDVLEQKNDTIQMQLRQLLESNREVRQTMAQEREQEKHPDESKE